MLLLTSLSLGCSNASATLLPTLENRTLWIDLDKPGFFYNKYDCVKKTIFGACKEYQLKKFEYDMTKAEVRKELIDMGFVCRANKVLP